MKTTIKIAIVLLYFLMLGACRNQGGRDIESGEGDNVDRNHPVQDSTQNSTQTDPVVN